VLRPNLDYSAIALWADIKKQLAFCQHKRDVALRTLCQSPDLFNVKGVPANDVESLPLQSKIASLFKSDEALIIPSELFTVICSKGCNRKILVSRGQFNLVPPLKLKCQAVSLDHLCEVVGPHYLHGGKATYWKNKPSGHELRWA
jgi:hypothetical protein